MSRVNYGPLIEQSPEKETPKYIKERSDYDAIDYMIMEYIRVLFNIDKKIHDDDAVWEFCVGHRLDGHL